MDGYIIKYNSRVEINDLIGDAVKNAVARRNETIDSEYALSALPNEEASNVAGGKIIGSFQPYLGLPTLLC